ncbi:MAG TPA: hypothetical protein VME92_16170 [Acetobacteraceae bacterium]|nr:hypothetical protein [Acetobacteraceae bacterium]
MSDRVAEILEEEISAITASRAPAHNQPREPRPARPATQMPPYSVESVIVSESGVLVIGWLDDREQGLEAIRVSGDGWSGGFAAAELSRVRRNDVERALGAGGAHAFGYWGLAGTERSASRGSTCAVEIVMAGGLIARHDLEAHEVSDPALRRVAIAYRAGNQRVLEEVVALLASRPVTETAGSPAPRAGGERRNQVVVTAAPSPSLAAPAMPTHSVEALVGSPGGLFIVGWLDDRNDRLDAIRVRGEGWHVTLDASALARVRRRDVEAALGAGQQHAFGFWGFLATEGRTLGAAGSSVEIALRSGAFASNNAAMRTVDDVELRGMALSYLASSEYFGNPSVEAMHCLDAFLGDQIVAFNKGISNAIVANPYVRRFIGSGPAPRGSIVVCLYGKPEYLFLQNALFAGGRGMEEYEFVYISNSPELAERLLREARLARTTYGLDQTLVLLPGNAGFGAANNAAVAHCRSDRILIVNPDVFPYHADWAARHSELLAARPAQETRLFGAPLYYDDGTLMHGGMHFEIDTGLSMETSGIKQRKLLRVEHFAKGAPAWAEQFNRPRPVPAVTGAFMSVERAWFETLGGFTEDYVFGHYEDADLCLKSLQRGYPAWIQDLRFWHLEGKGSIRQPVHEGGSLVNRWLFSRSWGDTVAADLEGKMPTHPLLAAPAEEAEPPVPAAVATLTPPARPAPAPRTRRPTPAGARRA